MSQMAPSNGGYLFAKKEWYALHIPDKLKKKEGEHKMIYRLIVTCLLFSKLCVAATTTHDLEREKQKARIQDTHEQEFKYLQERQTAFLNRLSAVGDELDQRMRPLHNA